MGFRETVANRMRSYRVATRVLRILPLRDVGEQDPILILLVSRVR